MFYKKFLRKNIGGTTHPCVKSKPTLKRIGKWSTAKPAGS